MFYITKMQLKMSDYMNAGVDPIELIVISAGTVDVMVPSNDNIGLNVICGVECLNGV